MSDSSIDQQSFRRILNRNVGLPLGFGFLSAFFFSAIVYYLLNVNHTAERSVEEVAVAHETFKVLIDLESGMRGYLIAGEEVFLQPYLNGLPVLERGMA
ncbi:CHASE3 domain-containing protein, partial [Stutzerimonas nitrititolerans]